MSSQDFKNLGKEQYVLYDLKYVLDKSETNIRL